MGNFQTLRYSLAAITLVMSSASISHAQNAERNAPRGEQATNDMNRGLTPREEGLNDDIEEVSPVRRIGRNPNEANNQTNRSANYRSIDGSANNLENPDMNSHGEQLQRLLPASYADGISSIAGAALPNPRSISNAVSAQPQAIPNSLGATDFFWQWGQFLDHDIDLTDGASPAESANIAIPVGDIWFDPQATGERVMSFNRSLYDTDSGTNSSNPRQQLNEISGWIDASNVYGSDSERALALRELGGNGYLKTSEGELLPYNVDGLPNAGGVSDQMFLAGDVRANEQVGLTALHTLFVREHNRLVDALLLANPSMSGEQAYQQARRTVGAQMQVITYQEFLPLLLGENALPEYRGYQPQVDAGIVNSFSTAAYRLGHSLLSTQVLRLDENMDVIAAGNLPLRNAFFSPSEIEQEGIDSILRGLAGQVCQELDAFVVDDIRNFLFGAPGSDGFDLASLNIQRGRDHGLSSYNGARIALGLEPATSFAQLSSNVEVQQRLASVYNNVDEIDLWVGGLAEDHVDGAMVGEVFGNILAHQFAVLRDGDRFWYERTFNRQQSAELQNTTLADIVRRNTDIGDELQDTVMQAVTNAVEPQGQRGRDGQGQRQNRGR